MSNLKKIGIECHTIEKEKRLGAGGNYLLNILKEWSKLSPDEYRFILYFKDRIPSEKILAAPVFTKKIIKIPGIRSTAFFYNILLPLKAFSDKVDILFLPFYMRPFFCFSQTVAAVHDISFKTHPEWFSWNYKIPFQILSKFAIKTSRAILACSEYTKKEIINNYKISPKKIHVVYLAADKNFNEQKKQGEIKRIKKKYGLNKKYLFFTGNIFNRRHILESIKAFENLKEYQFLISGRDFTRPAQNIDKKIEKINKKIPDSIKKVKFVDYEDLIPVYQGSDLFIWLSEYEGFGLPVLEAMACGVPVLTTKKTSLGEVMGDYPIWVENPINIKEISVKMQKILNDEKLRKESINKGLMQTKKFSWQKTAEETLKIIENETDKN